VGPFGFGDRTFDNHVVDLYVVVSLLPFIVIVDVGTSSDCEDCIMGEKVVDLLWRLTNF
jgi:hypothetical protein